MKSTKNKKPILQSRSDYTPLFKGIADLFEQARRSSVRAGNFYMTAAYWDTGRRIIEYEQGGKSRAMYGEALLVQLANDLNARFGRGFGVVNLSQMKKFYLLWPEKRIFQTLSEKSFERCSLINELAEIYPLPWSAYVRLMSVKNEFARKFYETETLRAGWSIRQLDRQIESLFYERTALSKNKVSMLIKAAKTLDSEKMTADGPYSVC